MKFAVTVNDGAKHIVNATTTAGALKVALSSLHAIGEGPNLQAPLLISIVPIPSRSVKKADAKPELVVG